MHSSNCLNINYPLLLAEMDSNLFMVGVLKLILLSLSQWDLQIIFMQWLDI